MALLAAFSLAMWALCILLGTGLGYDHPVHEFFDGGLVASLWRIAKAIFLGTMAWAVLNLWLEHIGEAPKDPDVG